MATKNLYTSLFGESPETQQARENRNQTFQDMLASRRQAAEQARTDNVQMARYNALGNVLTTMVQPLGWAAGGSTAGVQKYDDRQYIDAFNRALKAQDDLRNIGTAEDQYRFNLAEQDYNRMRDIEDNERRYQFQMDKQQQQYENQLAKQQAQFENQQKLQEQKAADAQELARLKASFNVSKKGTGVSVDDKLLLEEFKAYNAYVNAAAKSGKPYDNYETWMSKRGYEVARPARTTSAPAPKPSASTSTSTSTNRPTIQWAN